MTTRAQLEKKLIAEADKLGLKGKRKFGYVYGPLNVAFPIRAKRKSKKAGSGLLQAQANPLKKKAKAKTVSRRKNPVTPATKSAKVNRAVALYERFRLENPEYVEEINLTLPDVAMVVGECDGILYTTIRDGKKEKYVHKFAAKSKPTLAASSDGKQLLLIGGHYNFTERGIVDF